VDKVSDSMRSRLLEKALLAHIYGQCEFLMPRFTPPNWWECDVWAMTRSGYAVEYEIKVSRADFRRDGGKRRENLGKLQMIAEKDGRCQNRFYYVMPRGMIELDELPANCGLITFGEYPADESRNRAHCFSSYGKVVLRAPLLHNRKPDSAIQQQGLVAAYHRFIRGVMA